MKRAGAREVRPPNRLPRATRESAAETAIPRPIQQTVGNQAVQRLLRSGPTGAARVATQTGLGNQAALTVLRSTRAVMSGPASPELPIQRYFELSTATHGELGVTAIEGTSFPGHEEDVEHKDFLEPETRKVHRVESQSVPDLMVSDDGNLAIEKAGTSREVEAFFGAPNLISASNEKLASVGSKFLLSVVGGEGVDVPDLEGKAQHKLSKVVGQKAPKKTVEQVPEKETVENAPEKEKVEEAPELGKNLIGPEQCVEMAEEIVGQRGELVLRARTGNLAIFSEKDLRERFIQFLAAYLQEAAKDQPEERAGKAGQYVAIAKEKVRPKLGVTNVTKTVSYPVLKFTFKAKGDADKLTEEFGKYSREETVTKKRSVRAFVVNFIGQEPTERKEGYYGFRTTYWDLDFRVADSAYFDDFATILAESRFKKLYVSYQRVADSTKSEVDTEATVQAIEERAEELLEIIGSDNALLAQANRDLGLNEHAQPEVGEAYEIFHKGTPVKREGEQTFPYHFAAVVAKSGSDSVTFENYARLKPQDLESSGTSQRMYFQMYGPKRDVTVAEGQVKRTETEESESEREKREWAAGSFHGRWKGLFTDAETVAVGKPKE